MRGTTINTLTYIISCNLPNKAQSVIINFTRKCRKLRLRKTYRTSNVSELSSGNWTQAFMSYWWQSLSRLFRFLLNLKILWQCSRFETNNLFIFSAVNFFILLSPGSTRTWSCCLAPDLSLESIQHYTTSQNFQEFWGKQLVSEKALLHWWLKQAMEFCFSKIPLFVGFYYRFFESKKVRNYGNSVSKTSVLFSCIMLSCAPA